MRAGSGTRAAGSAMSSFTMWPRNEGSSTPSTTSVGLERGLANCPAARASLTTGSAAPYVSTVAICSMILRLSRMRGAVRSRKLSAQSPECSRKPRPAATSPSARRNCRASPANTSGGMALISAATASTAAGSGQSGC